MSYTIHPYSTDKGNTTKSVNDSISSIMSWMIQIAGRLSERAVKPPTFRCGGVNFVARAKKGV